MSDADRAFEAAERLIAEAAESGVKSLNFDREETRALTRLPDSIGTLEALRYLDLVGTDVTDLEPLSALTTLRSLKLDNGDFSDLSTLTGLTGLQTLRLDHTRVRKLTPISALTGLQTLWLDHTRVNNIAPLSGLTHLRSLRLRNTRVSNLTPLSALTGLQTLTLDGTLVSDLSPLRPLTLLSKEPLYGGLRFHNTPAIHAVPRLAEIAVIKGDKDRAQALFGWLDAQETPAEKAFRAAERLIAEAKDKGAASLTLDRRETQALMVLPESIAELTTLRSLDLEDTQVSDLSPLTGLTGLRVLGLARTRVTDLSPLTTLQDLHALWIDRTEVQDLTPVLSLPRLVEAPLDSGLTFKNCAATETAEIDRISRIGDPAERARTLFGYLQGTPPPSKDPLEDDDLPIPAADDLIVVDLEEDRLEIPRTHPSAAEVDERLKQVLHDQLRDRSAALSRAAGNRYPRLAARARTLEGLLGPDLAETDLLQLHLAVEDLRIFEETGEDEAGDTLPSEVLGPLKEVLDRGPGLTLGNRDVDALQERANRRRTQPDPEDVRAAQDDMSRALASNVDAIGDRLRDLEERVSDSDTSEAHEVQTAANYSVLRRIGLLSTVLTGASIVLPPSITVFIQGSAPVLLAAAATYDRGLSDWFRRALDRLVAAGLITASVLGRPPKQAAPPPPPPPPTDRPASE